MSPEPGRGRYPHLNGGYSYRERVRPGGAGLSVPDYYARFYPHSDRPTWAARLLAGEIELEGRPAQAGDILTAGARLVWHRPPWTEPAVPTEFSVLYEDRDLLAVCKPPGLPTLPAGGFLDQTLLTLLRRRWPAATPLHRLGRGTSGLVLCGLNAQATARLLADWRSGQVEKRYRALSAGVAPGNSYDIAVPIGPVAHPKLGQVYAASESGKAAYSRARVLARRTDSTLFEVDILTGRPHQIRIHLAAAGWPLVGDPLYVAGGHPRGDAVPGDLGYWLHAERLRVVHPRTRVPLTLYAPVPPTLEVEETPGTGEGARQV
ncbi:RluA family pseudouridine synthase [Deinococcus lacus]|uniref:RluA family pseudouridine synthase n=1 Tax=Deinococcus lacus TaxID=392561 RepID=A0ABW1YG12_9DEIO